jgi:2-amino-4-hydroxy-6-hydroxymethyldihydropteridine diphosphokinase
MKYYISIGTNLNRKRQNLMSASRMLTEHGIKILRASSIYRTEPVDFRDQPWFFNQVLEVDAPFEPRELLNRIQAVEKDMKRIPRKDRGPRIIDIDILLAGQTIIKSPGLVVPHPRMDRRNFVLVPLAEIAPDAIHPVIRKKIRTLMRISPDRAVVRKAGDAR